jgi:hypothetical protein
MPWIPFRKRDFHWVDMNAPNRCFFLTGAKDSGHYPHLARERSGLRRFADEAGASTRVEMLLVWLATRLADLLGAFGPSALSNNFTS